MARAKHGAYIFQRPGSENWRIKLRSPTGRVEKSLRTVDRREAEILAGPLITAHKAALPVDRVPPSLKSITGAPRSPPRSSCFGT